MNNWVFNFIGDSVKKSVCKITCFQQQNAGEIFSDKLEKNITVICSSSAGEESMIGGFLKYSFFVCLKVHWETSLWSTVVQQVTHQKVILRIITRFSSHLDPIEISKLNLTNKNKSKQNPSLTSTVKNTSRQDDHLWVFFPCFSCSATGPINLFLPSFSKYLGTNSFFKRVDCNYSFQKRHEI